MKELFAGGSSADELDEKAKPPVVQQRGRFKVTSENVDVEKVTEFLQSRCPFFNSDVGYNSPFLSGARTSVGSAEELQHAGS